ncbi:MAG: hypothetical protein ACQEQU_05510 [Spirochaetota bacterium]
MYSSIQRLRLTKSERILVLNAPESFREYEQYFTATIDREIKGRAYPCVFFFAETLEQAEAKVPAVLRVLAYDGLFWFCLPKGTDAQGEPLASRKLVADFFSPHGMKPVVQRHIDKHWIAFRIRPKELVRTAKKRRTNDE